eukprot:319272_1
MSETECNGDTKNDISQIPHTPRITNVDNIDCESGAISGIEQKNESPRVAIERTDRDAVSLQLNEATLAELMDAAEEIMSGEIIYDD